MKRIICSLALVLLTVAAFAQGSIWKQTDTVAEVEINDGELTLYVFNMPDDDQPLYYACLGTLGIGDSFIQLHLDPLNQLFIPLASTLEESQAKLQEIRDFAKQPEGTSMEITGTLSVANPSTGEQEPVTVTARRTLFVKTVEFSIQRNGYLRATRISGTDLGALITGVKFYRKLHPSEP